MIESPIRHVLTRLRRAVCAAVGRTGGKRTVEPRWRDGESNTEFGWHAGGGLEIHAGRHIGIHGDYRYTFLDFNGDDDNGEGGGLPIVGGLLPGYKGSQITLGATVYF